jgi:thiamine-monophosphate kinase
VGAEPVGILISEILPENVTNDFIQRIQKGIKEAVGSCGSFVLGGDTNYGSELILTGCALGRVPRNKILKRTGCSAGDILFSTGKLGRGNAYALSKFFPNCVNEFNYLPAAKLKEALIIREYASACIDTSDGAISALDQIMRLNNHGFYINQNTENILDRESMEVCKGGGISPWLLLAGEHGEFELLFTIPCKKENDFLSAACEKNWEPVRLGIVLEEPAIKINRYGRNLYIDSGRIRNLPYDSHGNVEIYMKKLLQYDKELFDCR